MRGKRDAGALVAHLALSHLPGRLRKAGRVSLADATQRVQHLALGARLEVFHLAGEQLAHAPGAELRRKGIGAGEAGRTISGG